MSNQLKGRTALITGANQGFGLAVARAYVLAGAHVMICARNQELLISAASEVSALAPGTSAVDSFAADVASVSEVAALVDKTLERFGWIDILVNNAGIYGPKGTIETVDWEDWRQAIEINLFGSMHMMRAVIPHMKGNGYGKIIQLSGGGATNPLPRISAYAASKAAIVRLAETVAEELRGSGIDVNSIAPGALNTRLLDEVLAAGPEGVGQTFYERSLLQKQQGGAPLQKGTALSVFLGSAASDGISGKLLSAIWDPWEELSEHREEINSTDIYTIRRIVPKDRGMAWGDK